jgi:hypothetical protein
MSSAPNAPAQEEEEEEEFDVRRMRVEAAGTGSGKFTDLAAAPALAHRARRSPRHASCSGWRTLFAGEGSAASARLRSMRLGARRPQGLGESKVRAGREVQARWI